jgi:uncharacterized peroxidase-related enzyme
MDKMTRINAIEPEAAPERARELLQGVQKSLGMTPNMMKTMANSPAVLEGYLSFNKALSHGALNAGLREQIAVTVAEANRCEYCLSAHTALGKAAGLSAEELDSARAASAPDPRTQAALRFAQEIVRERGHISDDSLARARQAGYTDAEIAEIIAHVALNILTNYINVIARTEVDFPKVTVGRAA